MASPLSPDMVRTYLMDHPEKNFLLDEEEFSDTFIALCQQLCVSDFNSISPKTSYSIDSFPSLSLLLSGTCWKMFLGRAALAARNTMNYQDGGISIPIEEKFEMYQNLAATFGSEFKEEATKLKININLESGYSSVSSDYALFPQW